MGSNGPAVLDDETGSRYASEKFKRNDHSIPKAEDGELDDNAVVGRAETLTAPRHSCDLGIPFKGPEQFETVSKTQKNETQKREMKIDKLSSLEKKNIVDDLVKISIEGSDGMNLSQGIPIASELLELDSADPPLANVARNSFGSIKSVPKLNIVMLIVGTRGDVQPFIAFARKLQEFGHRVRLATHVDFCSFVKSAGVDFYPLGGDPRILCGCMVRNNGVITSAVGDIIAVRREMKDVFNSLLPACTEPDPGTGDPFRAQAIIANPPSYGHLHLAEALRVPVHIFFTLPWTPTSELPHMFLQVPQSAAYRLSYLLVDLVIWCAIRDLINDFRTRQLKLPPIAYFSTYYGSFSHLPTAYMWSPHLLPKPHDWGPLVDIVGNCFLDLGLDYQPRDDLRDWLNRGPKPIFVGFGSMPLEDAKGTAEMIIEALKLTGQRGIISRGWGDLVPTRDILEEVFLIDECPHEWLFPRCAALIHHGGAGTTATGLRAGCPTAVVAFFGDQFIWGEKIRQKGLGPPPIPISNLNLDSLSNAIKFLLNPEVRERVQEFSKLMAEEDGVSAAMEVFHRHLPPELPIPPAAEEEEPADALHLFLAIVQRWCCLPCAPKLF